MYDPHWMHIQIYADIAPTCSPTNKQQRLYETMSDVTVTMNKYEQRFVNDKNCHCNFRDWARVGWLDAMSSWSHAFLKK